MTGEGSLFDVPPAAIGRFRVSHQVGAGTSGPVFRAVHPESGAGLAIKLFTLDLAPERVSAVAADLETLLSLAPASEGYCEFIDAGVHGSSPFLVTSFAPGDSLDVALKQFGPAALIDLIPRLRMLAGALDAAAARDVLHGAIHPRDVLVSESSTLITGLGAWPILLRHGQRVPVRRPYRAPELADAAVTAGGDRFALAVLAYEWMTGRRAPSAFVARDMAALPGVDVEALGRVFAVALHADPGERYPSNEAFIADLAQVDVNEVEATFVSEVPKGNSPSRRRGRALDEPPANRLPLDTPLLEHPVLEEPVLDEPTDIPLSVELDTDSPDSDSAEVVHGTAAAISLPQPAPADRARLELPPRHDEPAPPPPPAPIESPTLHPRPAPAGTGRLLQEPVLAPSPSRTGSGRLIAGLLLGAMLGVGAGYVVWGQNGAAGPSVENIEPAAGDIDSSPPPAASAPQATPAGPAAGTSAETGSTPVAPSESKPAPVQESGNLLVRSTPAGATVFIDDQRRGVTPLTLQNVELGTRRVRIVRDGFTAEDRQVTLTRSRPSRSVEVRLTRAATAPAPRPAPTGATARPADAAARTGSLLIESRPTGASILLNGRAIGTTPMTIDDLQPGTYTVQLQLATFRSITTTVRVVAGARARAAASLVSVQEPE